MPLTHELGPVGGVLGPSADQSLGTPPPALFGAGERPKRYFVTPVGKLQNQEDKNSCVAHGFSKPLENALLARGVVAQICRADLYSGALYLDGHSGRDVGVSLGSMARWITERGVLSEWERPYKSDNVTLLTSPALDSHRARGVSLERIALSVDTIKDALLISAGVAQGHEVRANYEPNEIGIVPTPSGTLNGYHCTYLCGWDDDLGFLMEQSWRSWGIDHPMSGTDSRFSQLTGKRGYCWLPYGWITSGGMFDPHYARGQLEVE